MHPWCFESLHGLDPMDLLAGTFKLFLYLPLSANLAPPLLAPTLADFMGKTPLLVPCCPNEDFHGFGCVLRNLYFRVL